MLLATASTSVMFCARILPSAASAAASSLVLPAPLDPTKVLAPTIFSFSRLEANYHSGQTLVSKCNLNLH